MERVLLAGILKSISNIAESLYPSDGGCITDDSHIWVKMVIDWSYMIKGDKGSE